MSLLVALTGHVFSQPYDIKFEHLSIEDGLSQSSIAAITQDSRGFMWFGTLDGLNRYDGYGFTIYKHSSSDSNSIVASTISALYEDRFGYLWIGTMSAGLSRLHLDTGRITNFKNDPSNPNSLCDNRVRALLEDRSGVLWIGTRDGGLCKLLLSANMAPLSAEFLQFENDPGNAHSLSENHVRTLLEDRKGNLWIGTRGGGLNRFDRESGQFVRYRLDINNPKSLCSDNVENLYLDLANNLWIGSYGGGLDVLLSSSSLSPGEAEFVHFRNVPGAPQSLNDDFVETIFEDRTGSLWVGTTKGGLNRLLPLAPADKISPAKFVSYQNRVNDPYSISHNNIEVLYEDFSGILWVGTWGGGLSRINRRQKKFAHFKSDPDNPNSLCNNSVRAFCEDDAGALWIGIAGGGLDRLDQKTGTITHLRHQRLNFNSISHDDVRALAVDRAGVLWIGTYGRGISRLNLRTLSQELQVSQLLHEPTDANSLSDNFVWTILEDRDGKIWIGTNQGLNQFDPATEEFRHYKHDPKDRNSLSHDVVRAIYQDSRGALWIGTYDGLNRLDQNYPGGETTQFKRYY
ncbi:MAG TPA: two-component regulator propeller domain-containing protein, partial [bacterium]